MMYGVSKARCLLLSMQHICVLQVVEIELGEHIEMMLSDDTMREDHFGVMEVTELFEDEKVSG